MTKESEQSQEQSPKLATILNASLGSQNLPHPCTCTTTRYRRRCPTKTNPQSHEINQTHSESPLIIAFQNKALIGEERGELVELLGRLLSVYAEVLFEVARLAEALAAEVANVRALAYKQNKCKQCTFEIEIQHKKPSFAE